MSRRATSVGAMTDRSPATGGARGAPLRTGRPKSPVLTVRQPLPAGASILLSVSFFLILLALWGASTGLGFVSSFFLPSPAQVLRAGWQMYVPGGFLGDITVSVYRVLGGYLLAATME
ncbi:hypothetical protein WBO78_23375 [Bosea sp. CCNWLW174]|uniref:hypothetical protein n=1 Tax=unclassified Bosea (in: a-proteobacteria) TaxID=2653178 RepID=UPI003014FFFA